MKNTKKINRISFACPKDLWKQYEQACKASNFGRSQYLRLCMQNLIDEKSSFIESLPKPFIKKLMKNIEKALIMSEDK